MGILPEQPALFLSFMTSNQNTTSDHESQPYKIAHSISSPQRDFLN